MEQVYTIVIDDALVLVRGVGIDDVLTAEHKVLVIDPDYVDIFDEYSYMGYDVRVVDVEDDIADFVGLYNVASVSAENRTIIVCGDKPVLCMAAVASALSTRGKPLSDSLRTAASAIQRMYGVKPGLPTVLLSALNAVHNIVSTLGKNVADVLLGLAELYSYGGRPRREYSEFVSWIVGLTKGRVAYAAALLHFMAKGADDPRRLVETRIEATEKVLRETLGGDYDSVVNLLREYAGNARTRDAKLMRIVDKLKPGKKLVKLVEARGRQLVIHCPCGEHGEPLKDCVKLVSRVVEDAQEAGFTDVRIKPACNY